MSEHMTANERAELRRLCEGAIAEDWMRRWWGTYASEWIASSTGIVEIGDFITAASPDRILRLLAQVEEVEALAHRWETVPALRRGTCAADLRAALNVTATEGTNNG